MIPAQVERTQAETWCLVAGQASLFDDFQPMRDTLSPKENEWQVKD